MAYDLKRFLDAQRYDYDLALSEMKAGRKKSHYIWYIFPQLKGLGFSSMSDYYGISSLSEAKAYMEDPVLRARLLEITEVLLENPCQDIKKIMPYPDDLKLCSSMTLFSISNPEETVFSSVLEKYFHGKKDQQTLKLLGL